MGVRVPCGGMPECEGAVSLGLGRLTGGRADFNDRRTVQRTALLNREEAPNNDDDDDDSTRAWP